MTLVEMTALVPRLEIHHTSTLPHPQVVTEQLHDAELRRRMGEYVRTLLSAHPDIVATGWPLDVAWDERGIWATLTRGELVIPATWTRRLWWMPQRRTVAAAIEESLVWVLSKTHEMYADADETGRIRRTVSDGGEAVEVVLEPGVREEGGGATADGIDRYCRIGEHVALPLARAIEAGWVRCA